ncbi:MAG: glycosyltransferase family 2 protein [Candidatus Marinimicrobia bacterium]|nr:glycosyltransferase family 2 protein [Candidatus Neomarinimicrobiota bacterium]
MNFCERIILDNFPLISIVIAIRNEEKYIKKCLESCYNQTLSKRLYEILIIDGMSNDSTLSIVNNFVEKHKNLRIKILSNTKKIQAVGWNIGIKNAKGKYIILLSGHAYLTIDYLEKCLMFHAKYDAPCIGGVVKLVGEDNKSKSIGAAFNSIIGSGNAKYWCGTKIEYVETLLFGMYKKEVIEEVGYIDENLVRGEDWELNYKIVKKFGKMLLIPEIKSFLYAKSNFKNLFKRQFIAGLWKPYIFKKHPKSILFRHLLPPIFTFATFLSIIISIILKTPTITLSIIIPYLLVISSYSILLKIKDKSLSITYLIISFLIIHFTYGMGLILGIFKFLF